MMERWIYHSGALNESAFILWQENKIDEALKLLHAWNRNPF